MINKKWSRILIFKQQKSIIDMGHCSSHFFRGKQEKCLLKSVQVDCPWQHHRFGGKLSYQKEKNEFSTAISSNCLKKSFFKPSTVTESDGKKLWNNNNFNNFRYWDVCKQVFDARTWHKIFVGVFDGDYFRCKSKTQSRTENSFVHKGAMISPSSLASVKLCTSFALKMGLSGTLGLWIIGRP